ncbi:MAG: histidine kinase dimerization/phospho-acceptor domain-containing protein [Gaiellaceae bacterium]
MKADFSSLVSLACHDLRTPLATVKGFARTLLGNKTLDERTVRWLGMIDAASDELVEQLDLLSLVARIEGGRYDPVTREVDSLEVARAAVPAATGVGAKVQIEPEAVERSLAALARAVSRHGGVEAYVVVDGSRIAIQPVTTAAGPVVLGEEMKDLGAAVAVRVVRALGGEVVLDGERLSVTLPVA